ncbi:dnaJ homolog subfamily C member 30, mitochondrial [Hyalella azteca]|uniref:DnaJ homolog subfamily C member 30, mitochondrial n=1 Tax=Hyalella azteca TaxID=294128 RepID=A0A8B7PAT8_HYAAZ|nr:dnaJ homolog subfamily C member 30, mitochondrial [Hyalella azteca]
MANSILIHQPRVAHAKLSQLIPYLFLECRLKHTSSTYQCLPCHSILRIHSNHKIRPLSHHTASIGQVSYFSTQAKKSYYEILEISEKSTQAQIKEAYYKLSLKYHPDQQQDCIDASEKFRAISEAYEVLINLQKKKLYDKGLYKTTAGPDTPSSDEKRSSQAVTPVRQKPSTFYVDEWHQKHYSQMIKTKSQKAMRIKRRQLIKDRQDRFNSWGGGFLWLIASSMICLLFYEKFTSH